MHDATNVIIDCDPGCDDTVALISALKSPLINVLGITSIYGNVPPAITQKNALGICALMDRTDVPVFSGEPKPLTKEAVLACNVHGESGVQGLVLPFERAADPRTDMSAVDFILKETKKFEHDPVTLIVIGPMTNIATAYLRDQTLPSRVKIVTMGGAFGSPPGNITDTAEFNIFCDPLAASIVYENFKNITVLPLDVTHKTLQDKAFREWLGAVGSQGENLSRMLAGYAETYPADDMAQLKVSPLHDFHTIAYLTDPSIYQIEKGQVDVAVTGENEGQTTLKTSPGGPHQVALSVDRERFFSVLRSCLEHALR
jgi:purine nucleosidase